MFLIISLDRAATLAVSVAFGCGVIAEFLARHLGAVRKVNPVAWFRQGKTICLFLHKTNVLCKANCLVDNSPSYIYVFLHIHQHAL
jgi:predicted LPLAT superfamily acyltransferase